MASHLERRPAFWGGIPGLLRWTKTNQTWGRPRKLSSAPTFSVLIDLLVFVCLNIVTKSQAKGSQAEAVQAQGPTKVAGARAKVLRGVRFSGGNRNGLSVQAFSGAIERGDRCSGFGGQVYSKLVTEILRRPKRGLLRADNGGHE